MLKLYFVTENKNKFMEVKELFDEKLPLVQLSIVNWRKLEVQSDSLEEIVRFAVESLMKEGYCNFFIEDAGLFIKALRGFPGPYSSYVYKTIGVEGILKLMEEMEDREAFFMACIGLCWKNQLFIFIGKVEGSISYQARGSYGFGFDPIFIPKGEQRTFAEMDTRQKNRFSHRARAVLKMLDFLKDEVK